MSFRRVMTVAALIVVACVFVGQLRQLLADPTIWPPDDFVEYWAAAKLTLAGKNPYDPALLLPLQQTAGRQTEEAVMMWNPPWSLALVLPLGLLAAREAQLLWLAINFLAIGYCGDRLWLLFGGSRDRRWMGCLVVLIALPTAFALQSGQIGPLLLLGAVLFLECQQRERQFWAGAATVLLAVKPHLAYLIWVAILFDAIARGRWRVLVGGGVAGLVCIAVALAFNPQVLQQYADALGNRPPAQWVSPTIGTVLRLAFGEELFRLQFIPVAVGLLWFAWYCRQYAFASSIDGRMWDWRQQLPLLLLVSFVTAPYGAWPFDMVLLLPAAMWLIIFALTPQPPVRPALTPQPPVRPALTPQPLLPAGEGEKSDSPSPAGRGGWGVRAKVIVPGLIAVNLGCLALNLLKITSFWFLWVSPAILGLYLLAEAGRPRIASSPVSPVPSSDRALVTA